MVLLSVSKSLSLSQNYTICLEWNSFGSPQFRLSNGLLCLQAVGSAQNREHARNKQSQRLTAVLFLIVFNVCRLNLSVGKLWFQINLQMKLKLMPHQMILGWINTVQVSVAFAFSFGMHAPFMFEYRWKRIFEYYSDGMESQFEQYTSLRHHP